MSAILTEPTPTTGRPGLNANRLVRLMRDAVERCRIDFRGMVILTEAASGSYAVTPVLAALAGAERVYAVTRSTRYGTATEIAAHTTTLARRAGIEKRIAVVTGRQPELFTHADIITNSGHVRPIDEAVVRLMKPTAVVPLMYESWEYRRADLDLQACFSRDICVAGTNERHPAIDVFSYLGVMAVKLLHDAGVAVYRSKLLILCDNPFAPFIEAGLTGAGAMAKVVDSLPDRDDAEHYDAIVVAARPGPSPVVGPGEADLIARWWPGAVVVQFWGDIDRTSLHHAGVPAWPAEAPGAGHMGVLPSAVGPEAIVRLQSGGLKVGEILCRQRKAGATPTESIEAVVRSGFGMPVDCV